MKNSFGLIFRILLRRRLSFLKSLIVNDEDRLLFDDAARCLLAGANRSAYVTSWLCAAASIRSKLEIVGVRDSHVGKKLKSIDDAETKGQSIDRMLLDAAKDYGMIGDDDFDSLENIRQRRNIYAHPRKSAPIPDEVLGALGTVVRSLLSKPPLLRFGYATEVIQGVFEERHFLDDVEDRVIEFGKGFSNRIDPQINPWVFRTCIEKLDQLWDDGNLTTIRLRGLAFIRGFLLEKHYDLGQDEWKVIEIARKYSKATPIVLSNPVVWKSIPMQGREIIIGYLSESVQQGSVSIFHSSSTSSGPLPSQAFDAIKLLHDSKVLDEREEERLSRALISAPLERLAQYGIPLQEWVDRVLEDLTSYNWYTQNPAIDALLSAGSEQIRSLSIEMQDNLGRNVMQAANGGSNSAEHLLHVIQNKPNDWPTEFIRGVIFECFVHESGEHRFKNRLLSQALLAICGLSVSDSIPILNDLISSLESSSPKSYVPSQDYDQAIEILKDIESDYEFLFEQSIDTRISKKIILIMEMLKTIKSRSAG